MNNKALFAADLETIASELCEVAEGLVACLISDSGKDEVAKQTFRLLHLIEEIDDYATILREGQSLPPSP